MTRPSVFLVWLALIASACAYHKPALATAPQTRQDRVDVQLASDEPEAVVRILHERLAGLTPADTDWEHLFATEGYRHLAERERGMNRPFTDSAFEVFLLSDTLLARARALDSTLVQLEHADVHAAAARALAYLPPSTPLHARLYLEIKPATNSFVFTGSDSVPSIFLYVRPHETSAQLENTLAHELHHIGLNAACPEPAYARASPADRMLFLFLGAFGEGEAMLAAAGSPRVNPHLVDADSVQQRWNKDVAGARRDIDEYSRFFRDVLDGRITSTDSVRLRASSYFGVQGPWYTVGWLMASTVERDLGRPVLINDLCDPVQLLQDYNRAASRENARGGTLPLWDATLLQELAAARARAL